GWGSYPPPPPPTEKAINGPHTIRGNANDPRVELLSQCVCRRNRRISFRTRAPISGATAVRVLPASTTGCWARLHAQVCLLSCTGLTEILAQTAFCVRKATSILDVAGI